MTLELRCRSVKPVYQYNICLFISNCIVFSSAYFDYKEDGVFPKPPSYNVATTLPSYDEAERTKAETTVPLVTGRVSISFYSFFQPPVTFSTTHSHTCTQRCLCTLCARKEVLATHYGKFSFFVLLSELC